MDPGNVGISIIIGLGDFEGGELWVHDPEGDTPLTVESAVPGWAELAAGMVVYGTTYLVHRKWVQFDGSRPYAIMPISSGSGSTVVLFSR